MKRAIIVHGWDGSPTSDWFPWMKKELEKAGWQVNVPAMPDTRHPKIIPWTQALDGVVGIPDQDTILIGHSIGCQTILRFVSRLPATFKLGGAFLVAPWVHLYPAAMESEEDQVTAKPWLETPIEWDSARHMFPKAVACFSDDDPFVPATDAEIFQKMLGADIVELGKMGHVSGKDGHTEVPKLLTSFTKHWK